MTGTEGSTISAEPDAEQACYRFEATDVTDRPFSSSP